MKSKSFIAALCAAITLPQAASSAVSASEAAKLGNSLTPIGAEKNGNAAGTIPAWTGGQSKIPAGFKTGGHYPDPFADEKPKFTIDCSNG